MPLSGRKQPTWGSGEKAYLSLTLEVLINTSGIHAIEFKLLAIAYQAPPSPLPCLGPPSRTSLATWPSLCSSNTSLFFLLQGLRPALSSARNVIPLQLCRAVVSHLGGTSNLSISPRAFLLRVFLSLFPIYSHSPTPQVTVSLFVLIPFCNLTCSLFHYLSSPADN